MTEEEKKGDRYPSNVRSPPTFQPWLRLRLGLGDLVHNITAWQQQQQQQRGGRTRQQRTFISDAAPFVLQTHASVRPPVLRLPATFIKSDDAPPLRRYGRPSRPLEVTTYQHRYRRHRGGSVQTSKPLLHLQPAVQPARRNVLNIHITNK